MLAPTRLVMILLNEENILEVIANMELRMGCDPMMDARPPKSTKPSGKRWV